MTPLKNHNKSSSRCKSENPEHKFDSCSVTITHFKSYYRVLSLRVEAVNCTAATQIKIRIFSQTELTTSVHAPINTWLSTNATSKSKCCLKLITCARIYFAYIVSVYSSVHKPHAQIYTGCKAWWKKYFVENFYLQFFTKQDEELLLLIQWGK